MAFRDLFIVAIQKKPEKGETVAAAAPKSGAVGVFITPKSLLAFPTASFVVTLLGLFARKISPSLGGSIWVPVISAFFVGTVIFVTTIGEPSLKPRSWQDWFVSVAVGLVNCVYLAAAALGLLSEISKPS